MRETSTWRTERRHGRPAGVGKAAPGFVRRRTAAPPELRDGQVRCPVCRNGVTPLVTGFLRAHRDVFGLKCYNRRPPEPD